MKALEKILKRSGYVKESDYKQKFKRQQEKIDRLEKDIGVLVDHPRSWEAMEIALRHEMNRSMEDLILYGECKIRPNLRTGNLTGFTGGTP